jgi:hypothetical protein
MVEMGKGVKPPSRKDGADAERGIPALDEEQEYEWKWKVSYAPTVCPVGSRSRLFTAHTRDRGRERVVLTCSPRWRSQGGHSSCKSSSHTNWPFVTRVSIMRIMQLRITRCCIFTRHRAKGRL